MASSDFPMRGVGEWRWRAFTFVTSMTLSPAKPPRTAKRIANHCRASARSGSTGCKSAVEHFENAGEICRLRLVPRVAGGNEIAREPPRLAYCHDGSGPDEGLTIRTTP